MGSFKLAAGPFGAMFPPARVGLIGKDGGMRTAVMREEYDKASWICPGLWVECSVALGRVTMNADERVKCVKEVAPTLQYNSSTIAGQ